MNQSKIKELSQRVVVDTGGVFTIALCYIGDRLGLFRAMADGKPLTSEELAQRTNLNERYVREWLKGRLLGDQRETRHQPRGVRPGRQIGEATAHPITPVFEYQQPERRTV